MKNINSLLFILLTLAITLVSCRDDFEFEPSTGTDLKFSRDTVYLDTIFSNIGSSTYQLKVYNTSNKDIKIPKIQLKNGEQSNFRISVDGFTGKSFENIELLAKDSMFVFVETTADINQLTQNDEFLYTDELQFQAGNIVQKVELVTLIKDAYFLYPQKFSNKSYESIPFDNEQLFGFFLDENDPINGNELEWTDEKPYVIYGYAAVPPNQTLNVQEGTEVHFHAGSGLLVYPTAQANIEGSISKPVVFQGDRLEPSFEETPGQWDMIFFIQNSSGSIKNAIIKNATVGLFVNTKSSTIQLENLQIYNCSNYGLLGRAAQISGKNIVTNNIGKSAVALTYGGTYEFTHCTFANYWNRAGHTALTMDNYDGSSEFALNAEFKNSIVHSAATESIRMYASDNQQNFNFNFDHCLIKFFDVTQTVYNKYPYFFEDNSKFNNCLISRSNNQFAPNFSNISKNKLMITQLATSIIGFGSQANATSAPQDLLGVSRVSSPDLGAYQHITITNE